MGGCVVSEIVSLSENRDEALARARGVLRAGELVVMPTDTVYGVGADAFNHDATRRIFVVKMRPRSLPLPVLVSRPRQAWALAAEVPDAAAELAGAFWPGALTMILRDAGLDWDLGDATGSVAMRMPGHDDLLALLEMVGPMAVTSANLSGEPTPRTAEGVKERLGDTVGLYLDGGPSPGDAGSTIVDLTGPEPVLVREGPITAQEVEQVVGAPLRRG